MKKIYLSILACAGLTLAQAQSTRMVLIEEATNASCGPCAAQNPGFHTLLNANTSNVTSIKYQVWWPGYDPMYEDNEADVDARIPYYNIQGAPTAVIDGVTPNSSYPGFLAQWYAGAPGGITQASLDYATDVPASFDIELSYAIYPHEISVTATATCTQAVTGNLRFHIVVIEEEINFASAPGTNGETVFYNVMKKMLPSAAGSAMGTTYEVGETFTTTQTWNHSNVYNLDEIAVVAFVQNATTKAVHQAAFSNDAVLEAAFELDASSVTVVGLDAYTCETTVSPSVEIRNNGSVELTSATISYTLDNVSGEVQWTGNLGFYETEVVELEEIELLSEESQILTVVISEPNGMIDSYEPNDAATTLVGIAGLADGEIEVRVYTDFYPSEASWQIRNSSNQIVASGGPYQAGTADQWGGGGPDANTTKIHVVQMPNVENCYSIRLLDSFGDGMSIGTNPMGFKGVEVFRMDESIAAVNGETFTSVLNATQRLKTSGSVSVENNQVISGLNVFPNPSNGIVNVELMMVKSQNTQMHVYDITGKVVLSEGWGTMSEGYTLKQFDLSSFEIGLYIVNITTGDITTAFRVALVN